MNDSLPAQPGDETMKINVSPSAEETMRIDVTADDQPDSVESTGEMQPKKRRGRFILWGLGGLIILLLFIGLGALLGYYQGIENRTSLESTQIAAAVEEQFILGVQDMEAGNYERARQRFDYVIGLNPDYPEVIEMQAQVLLIINATATPTPEPTATPTQEFTPTPDLRGEDDLFVQAQDFIRNEEWDNAVQTLENLRKKNPEYHAIDVDGMFYVSLRNRGVRKIGLGDLEEGIYDLSLAEGFGPLDTEANSWRTWARLYIVGASFWEVNWGEAAFYFGQVAPMTPNMHDGSGWTASTRYIEALTNYAEQLMDEKAWCSAEEQLRILRDATGDDSLQESIDFAADKCR